VNRIGPEEILKLARNFMECRILLSGVELNLFTILAPTPLTAQETARRIGADLRPLTILLDALSAMELLVKRNGTYQCAPAVSDFLSADAPNSVLPIVLHMAHVWERWSKLSNIVRGTLTPEKPVTSSQGPEDLRAFIGAMDVIAKPLARTVVAEIRSEKSRALLDVGGASGTYTLAFLKAVPEMKATLFDKPEVIEMARQCLTEAGVLDRVTLVPGDFYRDDLPKGHDLAFLSAIIHQNSLEQNLGLFLKVFHSLNPGGRVIIRDYVMETDRTSRKEGAIFAVNMLVSTPGGNTYTFEEIKNGLAQAGFTRIHLLQRGEHMDGLVEAFKP
jgi:precorrin-6B methylase 2